MSQINGFPQDYNYNTQNSSSSQKTSDFNIEEIDFLFSTEDVELKRTDFDSTFESIEIELINPESKAVGGSKQNNQAKAFYDGLLEDRNTLCEVLDIPEEKYDSLACVALALASQETGMGSEDFSLKGLIKEHEIGYQNENTWAKGIRDFFIKKENQSASSGLTQMKIYDFMQDEELNGILKDFGVEAKSETENNLYLQPNVAAKATIIVLNNMNKGYDGYIDKMKEKNESLKNDFTQKNLNLSDVEEEGKNILNTLSKEFENLNIKKQKKITEAFINVMYALTPEEIEEREKKGEKVSAEKEEDMIDTMNNLLTKYGIDDIQLNSENLNSIRYVLTLSENRLNRTEFLAHTWNKGSSGEKVDAYLSTRIRTLLNVENSFDDSQYVSSVANLTEKYANQIADENNSAYNLDSINEFLA